MRLGLLASLCLGFAACAADGERPAEPLHLAQFVVTNPAGAAASALPSVADRRAVRQILLGVAGPHRFADRTDDSNIQNRFAVFEEQDVDEPALMVARGFPGRIVIDIGDSARIGARTSFQSVRDRAWQALSERFAGRVRESGEPEVIPVTYQQTQINCLEPAPRFDVNRPLTWPYDRCIDIWGRTQYR